MTILLKKHKHSKTFKKKHGKVSDYIGLTKSQYQEAHFVIYGCQNAQIRANNNRWVVRSVSQTYENLFLLTVSRLVEGDRLVQNRQEQFSAAVLPKQATFHAFQVGGEHVPTKCVQKKDNASQRVFKGLEYAQNFFSHKLQTCTLMIKKTRNQKLFSSSRSIHLLF